MADRTRPQSFRKTRRCVALIVLAAIMSLAAVADSLAQVRGGFNGGFRGHTGPGLRTPDGPRGPGLRDPGLRNPGFGHPRFPGNGITVIPPGFGPRGPIIVETVDDTPHRRVTKQTRPQKQVKRIAPRGGFNVPPPGETRFVANEVLLTIGAGVSTATLETMARRQRLTRMESQEFALTGQKLFRWRINDGRPVATVIRTLMADARILAAQPNYVYTLQGDTPVQTKSDEGAQYALAKLRLPQAHAISKGESVTIAVIDTALDAAHPELAGVIAKTFDATGTPDKPQPHGTAMAGAIAAHGKLMGTAPAVKLLAVQAFSAAKSEGTSFSILKGLEWAANEGAKIVNMSFAGPADPAVQAMLGAARAKGIVLIAAAGNAGPRSRPLYPAADPNVIAVTATDADDKLFERAVRGTHIAVAAPGVDILVAAPDGGYTQTSGTSVAAAEVSGIVALMLARDPALDPAAVRKLLTSTARDLGPAGPDDQFGAGLTDAFAALGAVPATQTETSRAGPTQ